jgi:hypothetical protein
MTLNPDELEVTSFETAATGSAITLPTIDNPNEPTPMTHCYWCPGETYRCD